MESCGVAEKLPVPLCDRMRWLFSECDGRQEAATDEAWSELAGSLLRRGGEHDTHIGDHDCCTALVSAFVMTSWFHRRFPRQHIVAPGAGKPLAVRSFRKVRPSRTGASPKHRSSRQLWETQPVKLRLFSA